MDGEQTGPSDKDVLMAYRAVAMASGGGRIYILNQTDLARIYDGLHPLLAARDAALADTLLDCVHQPNPTDLTRWGIAPGKHKAFSKLCADLARIKSARKQPTSSETNVNESATNGA